MFKLIINTVKLLLNRLPYILFTAFCFYGIFYLAQISFYRFMPPQYFLNVKSASIETAQVNQPLNLTFCRDARATYPNSKAQRSYYKIEGDKRINAGQYPLVINYEQGDICQVVVIPPAKHPKKSGIYEMQTSVHFAVKFGGYTFEKNIEYKTDGTFRLSDTVQGLQDQIIELQNEIEILKDLLRDRGVDVPRTVTGVSSAIVAQNTDTSTSFVPTTSEPPDETANIQPATPAEPNNSPNPNPVRSTVNFVENATSTALKGAQGLVDGTLKLVGL